MFSNCGRWVKNLYEKAFDFGYSNNDDYCCARYPLSHPNISHQSSRISTISRESNQVLAIPCEFCNVLWDSNLLYLHQAQCPQNPANSPRPSAPIGSHRASRSTRDSSPSRFTNMNVPSSISSRTNHLDPPRCPITQEPFTDPVLAEDGHTFNPTYDVKQNVQLSSTQTLGKSHGERLVRPVAHFQVQWTIFLECTKHSSIQGSTFVQLREKIRRF
ncbi:unnamed protein product [Adineta ricciae]|uniref:Uncharacterized protein n=1 Tax=Adineta ricciae TaxID=249248 RepID=A0A815G6Y4_ADIRI|nr:unnamed protein product [Adineta ricciae]